MPQTILQLIYGSAAQTLFSKEDLVSLLKKSRANNAAKLITGALFYKDGNFLQVLEGPESEVRALYEKIKLDPRHTRIISFIERTISERDFPDWKMAFYDFSSELVEIPEGFSHLLTAPNFPAELEKYPEKLRPFLALYGKH